MGCCSSKTGSEHNTSYGQQNVQFSNTGNATDINHSYPYQKNAYDQGIRVNYQPANTPLQNNASYQGTSVNYQPADTPLEKESWYFGKIDINRCIKLLGDATVADGTFIVRDSTSSSGAYCISVKGRSPKGQCIFSVRLRETKNGFGDKQYHSALDKRVFSSMQEVIRFYTGNGISSNGYSVPLVAGLTNEHYYLGGDEQVYTSYEIKADELDLQKELGRGHFGSVWKGSWRKPNGQSVNVAVKKLHSEQKAEVEKFEKEANLLKMVYHDNIVTFIGVCKGECPMIVTELMSRGDLLKFLKSKDEEKPLKDLYYFADQVASGMKFLASKSIIHRDLAARNILLGEQHIVKIADFGLGRYLDNDEEIYFSSAVPLPIKWTAPEGLEPPRKFTTKSDVWSYGIFLTEVITRGQSPYPSVNIRQITKTRLVDHRFRMTREVLGPDCSESLYALMTKCWQSDPDRRPDFETVYKEIHSLYEPFVPISHYK